MFVGEIPEQSFFCGYFPLVSSVRFSQFPGKTPFIFLGVTQFLVNIKDTSLRFIGNVPIWTWVCLKTGHPKCQWSTHVHSNFNELKWLPAIWDIPCSAPFQRRGSTGIPRVPGRPWRAHLSTRSISAVRRSRPLWIRSLARPQFDRSNGTPGFSVVRTSKKW